MVISVGYVSETQSTPRVFGGLAGSKAAHEHIRDVLSHVTDVHGYLSQEQLLLRLQRQYYPNNGLMIANFLPAYIQEMEKQGLVEVFGVGRLPFIRLSRPEGYPPAISTEMLELLRYLWPLMEKHPAVVDKTDLARAHRLPPTKVGTLINGLVDRGVLVKVQRSCYRRGKVVVHLYSKGLRVIEGVTQLDLNREANGSRPANLGRIKVQHRTRRNVTVTRVTTPNGASVRSGSPLNGFYRQVETPGPALATLSLEERVAMLEEKVKKYESLFEKMQLS